MVKYCEHCGGIFDGDMHFCPNDGHPLEDRDSKDAPPVDPLIGKVVDRRYRVLSRLGEGGMGSVYRALQTSTRREVALKVIRGTLASEGTRRFMLEAQTTSALRNVHTVTIYDFGQDRDGTLYLAMELLEGVTLDAALLRDGPFRWQRALHICAQVAESLDEAHSKGIIHRDLKPANIFLTHMGDDRDFVKVLDFGIAKITSAAMDTNLTGTGMVLGTPRYIAPEQARGERIDSRADIYSLGVILFELLTGKPPFDADQPLSLMMKHCQDPVPPLRKMNPEVAVPIRVEDMVYAMLAKEPDGRPKSAAEVRNRMLAMLRPQGATKTLEPIEPEARAGGSPPATPLGRPAPATPAIEAKDLVSVRTRTGPEVGADAPDQHEPTPDASSGSEVRVTAGPGEGGVSSHEEAVPAGVVSGVAEVHAPAGTMEPGPPTDALARELKPSPARWAAVLGLLLLVGGGVVVWAPWGSGGGGDGHAGAGRAEAPSGGGSAGRRAEVAEVPGEVAEPPQRGAGLAAEGHVGAEAPGGPGGDAGDHEAKPAGDVPIGQPSHESTGGQVETPVAERRERLRIVTVPEGASVIGPGGRVMGKTPLELDRPDQALKVRLRLRGYKTTARTISPSGPDEVRVTLRRVARPRPRPRPRPAKDERLDDLMDYE